MGGVSCKEVLPGMSLTTGLSANGNPPPPVSPRKYKLEELLVRLYGKNIRPAKTYLAIMMNVCESTVYQDLAIPLGAARTIPAERLMVYASFFGQSPDELRNKSSDFKLQP